MNRFELVETSVSIAFLMFKKLITSHSLDTLSMVGFVAEVLAWTAFDEVVSSSFFSSGTATAVWLAPTMSMSLSLSASYAVVAWLW